MCYNRFILIFCPREEPPCSLWHISRPSRIIGTWCADTAFVSAFTGERLMFNLIDGNLSVCKGVSLSSTRSTAVSSGILNFLRAINGDTKLKILEELYKEPKTTKELSDILGIAPSTVSVHLKMMREAELIYPQRVQNQVYNRFLYENYQAFLVYLLKYFE